MVYRERFKTLKFGRTEPENEGLLQFKRGWGARRVNFSTVDMMIRRRVSERACPGRRLTNKAIAHHSPIRFLQLLGGLLYRHKG